MPTYTTTTLGLRWLQGGNLVSDIDAGFQALAEDVDGQFAARDALLGVSSGGSVRSGKSITATTQSTTSGTYGLLATPDRVQNVVLPTDGLLAIWYQALWSSTSAGDGRAAIFVGSNQIKVGENEGAPQTQAAAAFGTKYRNLHSALFGLVSYDGNSTDATDVTTGQVVGSLAPAWSVEIGGSLRTGGSGALGSTSSAGANVPFGGPCYVFAAAGTYDVSIQFKTAAGTLSVKNRKLWVRAVSFS